MAYKKDIVWHKVILSEEETKGIRAIMQGAFKRAGGRGDLPQGGIGARDLLKGSFIVDADLMRAGNVADAPSAIGSKTKGLAKLAAPSSEGGADNGLAEKLATIEKALAMLLTQGSASSHAPSATLPAPQAKTSKRKAA